jgi:hypothetical protein
MEDDKRQPTRGELIAIAIAPLDPSAPLEKKLADLSCNLGIADTMDAARRHAENENDATISPDNIRYPIRVVT